MITVQGQVDNQRIKRAVAITRNHAVFFDAFYIPRASSLLPPLQIDHSGI
jgi:hypothetical protein